MPNKGLSVGTTAFAALMTLVIRSSICCVRGWLKLKSLPWNGIRAEGGSVGIKWVKVGNAMRMVMKPGRDLLHTEFVLRISLQHGEVFKATTFP